MIAMDPPSCVPLLDPRHLDALELALGRGLRIVLEPRQLGHPAVQVRESDTERIDVRMRFRERLGDVFEIVPAERHLYSSSRRRLASASCSERSMIRRANGSVSRLSTSTASRIAT